MVVQRSHVHSENGGNELIYINKDEKRDEDEDIELLNPILLESIFETHSPRTVLNKSDYKYDDSTASTVDSLSEWVVPTLSTSSQCLYSTIENDDSSVDSMFSLGLPEHLHGTIRRTVSAPSALAIDTFDEYHLLLPSDVRYEGEVLFLNSSVPRQINLQPRCSRHAESIFVPKPLSRDRLTCFHACKDVCLADSLSTIDAYGGTEECKEEEEEEISNPDEEFLNDDFEHYQEEEYWGHYIKKNLANDFENTREVQSNNEYKNNSIEGDAINSSLGTSKRSTHSVQTSILNTLAGKCISCYSYHDKNSSKNSSSRIPIKVDSTGHRFLSAPTA